MYKLCIWERFRVSLQPDMYRIGYRSFVFQVIWLVRSIRRWPGRIAEPSRLRSVSHLTCPSWKWRKLRYWLMYSICVETYVPRTKIWKPFGKIPMKICKANLKFGDDLFVIFTLTYLTTCWISVDDVKRLGAGMIVVFLFDLSINKSVFDTCTDDERRTYTTSLLPTLPRKIWNDRFYENKSMFAKMK